MKCTGNQAMVKIMKNYEPEVPFWVRYKIANYSILHVFWYFYCQIIHAATVATKWCLCKEVVKNEKHNNLHLLLYFHLLFCLSFSTLFYLVHIWHDQFAAVC